MASSILFPKIQRYSMLPIRCIQPPCMNMEVKTVNVGGTSASSGGSVLSPSNVAGITPRRYTAISKPRVPSDSCHRKTSVASTIRAIVMYGLVVVGLSSCSGIIDYRFFMVYGDPGGRNAADVYTPPE